MITVNSSGIALDSRYESTVQADSRSFLAELYLNGTALSCDIGKIQISKGSCGTGEAFTIGGVISSVLTAEVRNLTTSVKGQDIEVRIGLEISGAYEWVTLGFFTITEVFATPYVTNLTGYGASVAKTADSFTVPTMVTLASIASSVSTATGVTVSFDSGIRTSDEIDEPIVDMSNYQALQLMATLVGGYAVDTNDGNIAIHKFDDTATLSVTSGMMVKLPTFEERDFEISGVVVVVRPESTDEEGTIVPATQYPVTPTGTENLSIECKYMMEDIYTDVFSANLVGYTYRPASIDLSLGDPRIEGNDVLSVTDVNGDVYIVPCHSVVHTYDGGFYTTIRAVSATTEENQIATASPITSQINAINIATATAQNSAQTAYDSAQSALSSATQALSSATDAMNYAESAMESANDALTSASSAYSSATSAQLQLSEVENVLGTVNWIAQHGNYELTEDTSPVDGKVYYILSDGQYVAVPVPDDDPITAGYYELIIDSAVSNYIASHLSLSNDGLYVMMDNNAYKLQIASTGIYLWSPTGIVAQYGENVVLGDANGLHMKLTSRKLGFWRDANTEVAYISVDTLHITNAEITSTLRIGNFVWQPRNGRLTLMYSPVS